MFKSENYVYMHLDLSAIGVVTYLPSAKMNNNIFVLVLLFVCLVNECVGLKCYTCSQTEDDVDTSCLDKPQSMKNGITDCDKKYCTIVRVDYKDPKGKLQSMSRNCVDKPIYVNKIIEDTKSRTYYRACRQDLCNTGSGHGDTNEITIGSLGDKSTIYCPGTNPDGATVATASVLFIFACVTVSLVLM